MTQQDDITQRLRDNADIDEAEHGNARVVQLEREAADEIERLRALLSKLRAEGVLTDVEINSIIAKQFGDDTAGAARALIVINQVLSMLSAPVEDKAHPRFMAGYDAGLKDGRASEADRMVPYESAAHWNDLYRKECRARQDEAFRYGSQIQDLEARIDATLASAPVADERVAQEYGSPADVAQRIEQYLAQDGRMNSGTQLLYEAMKALRASQGDRNGG